MNVIKVQDLAGATVTRARGAEAASKLFPLLAPEGDTALPSFGSPRREETPLEISLDGARLLSSSFLDEIIRQLAAPGLLERVAFVTGQQSTIEKLQRIAAIRNTMIYWHLPGEFAARPVSPRRVETKATFASKKAAAG